MPELIRITPALAETYRQVRLRALREDPMCFGSNYARESVLTDADWLERASSLDGHTRIGFLAMDAHEPCGLIACFQEEHDPALAQVLSMWVAPSRRGAGTAWSLLEAARSWAESRGIPALHLMVTSNNARAIRFYQRFGFSMTGYSEPWPNGAQVTQLEMRRTTAAL